MRRDVVTVRKDMIPNYLTSALHDVLAAGAAVLGHCVAKGYVEDPDGFGVEAPVSTIYAAPGGIAAAGLMLQVCGLLHRTPWGERVDSKLGAMGQALHRSASRCVSVVFARCRGHETALSSNTQLLDGQILGDGELNRDNLPKVRLKTSIPSLILTQSDHFLMVASHVGLAMIPILLDVSNGVDLYANEAARNMCYVMIGVGYYLDVRNYFSSFKDGEPSAKVLEWHAPTEASTASELARWERANTNSQF